MKISSSPNVPRFQQIATGNSGPGGNATKSVGAFTRRFSDELAAGHTYIPALLYRYANDVDLWRRLCATLLGTPGTALPNAQPRHPTMVLFKMVGRPARLGM